MFRNFSLKKIIFNKVSFTLIFTFFFYAFPLWLTPALGQQNQDPFVNKSIINPAWGFTNAGPWNPQFSDSCLDDWKSPHRPSITRTESWVKYPDANDKRGTSVMLAIYHFDTPAQAQQYLTYIFSKNYIAEKQTSYMATSNNIITQLDKSLKKNIGPWKDVAGGMATPTESNCLRKVLSLGEIELSLLSRKKFAYVIKEYAYHIQRRNVVEVKNNGRNYRIITSGNRGGKVINEETRGIYIRKQEYVMLILVSSRRMTSWDSGIHDGCNFTSDARQLPFPEDIWRHVSGENAWPDSDKDGVPDDEDECCTTPPGVKVDNRGCPICSNNEVYDPSSVFANHITGCSPKVAVMFTTKDPNLTWRHQILLSPRYGNMTEFFKSKGYKIISVDLNGYKDKNGVWHVDIETIVNYLIKPSTKAIAYFGHGGKRVKDNPYWWDDYSSSLDGASSLDFFQPTIRSATIFYEKKYCLNKKEIKNRALAKANNIGLEYAYIFACHSLDDNNLRNFLISDTGTYWGEPGVLTGTMPLKKVKGRGSVK